ncbi:MAG: hypothetical protein PHF84_02650 [bacterium]|nr:hypothetical protein [bacterium]
MYKKAIGIDIDGVIGDSDKIFRKYINQYYNLNLKRKDITQFYYEKILGITEEKMMEFWEYFNTGRFWLEIPLISNAKTSIDYLKDKYAIIIITARDEKLKEVTIEWLNNNKIHYDELLMLTENESKLSRVLQNNILLNAVIEDKLENALHFVNEGMKVYLFDYPWNQSAIKKENMERVSGWKEVLSGL